MKLSLPKSIASPQDLSSVVNEVKEYATWYSHEAIKKRLGKSTSHGNSGAPLSPAASELIRGWFGTKEPTRLGFDSLVSELSHMAQSATVITVTLAAPAPNSLKATLVEWFRKNLTTNALVTFHINSTILGGMVVQYGSRVFDWSFRRQIVNNKTAFGQVLRNVR